MMPFDIEIYTAEHNSMVPRGLRGDIDWATNMQTKWSLSDGICKELVSLGPRYYRIIDTRSAVPRGEVAHLSDTAAQTKAFPGRS